MSTLRRLHTDLELTLDRFALQVSIETDSHVTGLFGPSGCGKTSFLDTVAGLRRHARGKISFDGETWQDTNIKQFLPPEKRGIGYVPQVGILFPHLNVSDNLLSGARRARRSGVDPKSIFNTVVELLELGPLLKRNSQLLSGGERQRVALGRALCSAPKLLLLDEPLAALDQPLRRKVLPFLRRIRDEIDVPMLVVSHDPMVIQALCDDLLVLKEGSVVARGTPRDVLMDPNVFALADDQGFENIVPCQIVSRDQWLVEVALPDASSGLSIFAGRPNQEIQKARFVAIPARDIMVANVKPRGISARNILSGKVLDLNRVEYFDLLKVEIHPDIAPIAVEVGHPAVTDLNLQPGREVFLVIKAMACTLFEDRGTADPVADNQVISAMRPKTPNSEQSARRAQLR